MKIAVIRGGKSPTYEESLKTGEFILSHLRSDPKKYEVKDIFISKEGDWHVAGRKAYPYQTVRDADLVWNALHEGEDEVSRLLTNLRILHTGSKALGLALAGNRDLSKKAYVANGLPTPRHTVLSQDVSIEDLMTIFRSFIHPVAVKPVQGRRGTAFTYSFDELKDAVAKAFRDSERVMIEEYIRGKDVSCAVLEGMRGQKVYSFLPEPAKFKTEEHKLIEHYARSAHEALGLRHYSVSEFIVTPKGKIYIIETTATPELTKNSPIVKSLPSVGLNPKEFVEHVVKMSVDLDYGFWNRFRQECTYLASILKEAKVVI